MSKDETRDPIDVARETWPLDWREAGCGFWRAKVADLMVNLAVDMHREPWCAWVDHIDVDVRGSTPRTALTEARRLTVERLKAAAALCREPNHATATAGFTEAQQRFLEKWADEVENHVTPPAQPYPVQVERHRKTGEAVLFLTGPEGEALHLGVKSLGPDPVQPCVTGPGSLLHVQTDSSFTLCFIRVREPAEAIRETLRMLAEEPTP